MPTIYGLEDELKFGKFKGEQIEDLLHDQPGYMAWLAEEDIVEFEQEVLDKMTDLKII